jgi:hypothetical protein
VKLVCVIDESGNTLSETTYVEVPRAGDQVEVRTVIDGEIYTAFFVVAFARWFEGAEQATVVVRPI